MDALYNIDKVYVAFLRKHEQRVSFKEKRPYAVLLHPNESTGFAIPFTTQTHQTVPKSPLLSDYIFRNGEMVSQLLYNNMIPIHVDVLRPIEASTFSLRDQDIHQAQTRFVARNRGHIYEKAKEIYNIKTKQQGVRFDGEKYILLNKKDKWFYERICCDYKTLEAEYLNYQRKGQAPLVSGVDLQPFFRRENTMELTLERDLGLIQSLQVAPEGTRQKINEAYEAKLKWSQDKPRAYICSPLSAPDAAGIQQNMLAARRYCDVAERNMNVVGKAPHAWLPEFIDDNNPRERRIGLDVGLKMVETADACLVCGDRISNGMKAEIELAGRHDITVYSFHPNTRDEINQILGQYQKHKYCPSYVTSELNVLTRSPEAINKLNLQPKELIGIDNKHSKTMLKSFESRFKEELELLQSLNGYRKSRDHGGDTIRQNDDYMKQVEKHIISVCKDNGITIDAAQNLLSHCLEKKDTQGLELKQEKVLKPSVSKNKKPTLSL